MQSEQILTIAAIAFEVGLPSCLFLFFRQAKLFEKIGITFLGAVAPMLFFYALVTMTYLFSSNPKNATWAFHSMWVMGFFIYCLLGLVGVVLGIFLPPNTNIHMPIFSGTTYRWSVLVS